FAVLDLLDEVGAVLLLTDGAITELVQQQLDLVEVQPLVDGDHEAEVLERARDDLGRAAADQLGELGDRQEFVDPDRPRLLCGATLALGLPLQAARRLVPAVATLPGAALQLRHHALDVLLHRLLVYALALLLALLLLAAAVDRKPLGLDAHLAAGARTRGGRRHRAHRRQPFGDAAGTRPLLRRGLRRRSGGTLHHRLRRRLRLRLGRGRRLFRSRLGRRRLHRLGWLRWLRRLRRRDGLGRGSGRRLGLLGRRRLRDHGARALHDHRGAGRLLAAHRDQ